MLNTTLKRNLLNASGLALTLAVAAMPAIAHAQDADSADADASKEIVVTGTLIRGTAPVGSNNITLSAAKLSETGASSSNELLASIPQVTNYFNAVPGTDLGIAVNQIQISRPNIRNISGNNAASSATLILVDGHRIATAGVNQASVDPDAIPTGAIERVEVATEGGSATYGADAVAGVINFITRKSYDGIGVDAHFGTAKNYFQWDASVIAGKKWDTGSVYISYTYTKNDALYGRDRDFIHNLNYATLPYQGLDRTCDKPNLAINTVFVPANFTLSSVNYALPGLGANTFNACDNSQNKAFLPKIERHGALIGLSQELGDNTSIDVRAFYSQRTSESDGDLTGTVSVTGANPWTVGNLPAGVVLGGGVVATRAQVSFNMAPLLGHDVQHNDTRIKEWGANAELKHTFANDWQVRALANWSESDSSYNLTGISNSRLSTAGIATTTATAFNPFDVTKNNAALVSDLIDSEIAGRAKDSMVQLRLIGEGKLFELPGGDVRLAVGYEYMHDKLSQAFQSDIRIGTLGTFPVTTYSRNVHSLFGELNAPLISDGKGGSMLTVSAAVRYDHYSDFGSTTNPKFGVTFKPVEWIKFRGNYGTSFTAPTPLDQLGSLRNTISAFPFVAFTKPGDTPVGGSWTVAIQGSQPNLQPQTAHTWSIGVDIDPPMVKGLRASLSYYDVDFKNILRTPTPNAGIFVDFPGNITSNPAGVSAAQLTAFGTLAPGGAAVVNPLIAGGTPVYELVDFRVGNFGIYRIKGLDFSVSANIDTSFGSIDFRVDGNHQLSRKQQVSPTSAISDDFIVGETPRTRLQTSAGFTTGGLRGQVTWNHTSGYPLRAVTTGAEPQSRVSAFNTVDLFFRYEVPSTSSILKDLTLTLNVKNVGDTAPPVLRRTDNTSSLGFANGFSIGRMFIFGISKKF